MSDFMHTPAEGQRVHYLANLGGLVAIAGLEDIPPDIFVGLLSEIRYRFSQLSKTQIQTLQEKGAAILQRRAAEKSSFKRWQHAQETQRFDFTRIDIEKLIRALGGQIPSSSKDFAKELERLIRQLP